MKIMVGGRVLCGATLKANGTGECALPAKALGPSTYSVDARYAGNSFYNSSTSAEVRLRVT